MKGHEFSSYLTVTDLSLTDRSSGGVDLNLVGNFAKNLFETQFGKYVLIFRFLDLFIDF